MLEEVTFGHWLYKQRRALDLSRQAFADQVGCAEVTLRRIEAGTLKPSRELAGIILERLGIPETERPQWISFARGLSGFPDQSSSLSKKPRSNLPAPLTTFIGREKEQSDVIQLIAKHRLVTLTGSGGVGKTRLSMKAGEQIVENFLNGVWLVELAPILDPALVLPTTAHVLGLREDPQRNGMDMLCDYLCEKSMLLILDNCEHVLDTCSQLIAALLRTCFQLKILITSREPLNITGEAIYRVPSLELPKPQRILETVRNFESIRLFEERAQLVQFGFTLTMENAASVAKICQSLDGIPLAIELAAAKVAVFSTEQIAEQLEESLNLLTEGSRIALPRHQTLRASIAWSWNLLTESEQRLMRQLSVFAGGWTLNAAQVVCDGDVMNLLNSLVTKSLIVMNQRVETGIRFSFHETVRQYAHEKLLEVAGLEALCGKHLAYFVRLAEQAERELYRADQVRWLGKLADDIDNLRKSLDWALITNPELGLRLLVSLRLFWEARGDLKEVESWMKQFLGHYTTSDPLRAHALAVYSKVLVDRNAFAEAQKLASQSLEIAKMVSDKRVEAFSLWALGVSIGFQRDVRQGIPYLEQSLASYESLGDKLGQATALDWLSMDQSDKEQSKAFILNSLKLYRELGHLSGIAMCLADLASMLIDMGDFSSLLPLLEESLAIYRQLESYQGEAWVLTLYGRLAFWNGDYRKAYDYFEQSISLYERSSVSWSAWPRAFIANIFLRQGNIVQARKLFESNLQQVQKGDNVICLVYIVEGLASLYTKDGLLPRALQLYSWTNIMREKLGTLRPPAEQKIVERDLTVIHANLDNSEFASISEEGRAMTMEQAVALALVSSVPGANY